MEKEEEKNRSYHNCINDIACAVGLEAFVLPNIVSPQPSKYVEIASWAIPKTIVLADPLFNQSDKIDVLLGAEFYHQVMMSGTIRLASHLPTLQNTLFGGIVSGKVESQTSNSATCGMLTDMEEGEHIDNMIKKFWQFEEVKEIDTTLSFADQRCETHFVKNVQKNQKGQYIVKLPFAESVETSGGRRRTTFNRFLGLERRLIKDSNLRQQYVQFMVEYEALGHMIEVDVNNWRTTPVILYHIIVC
ncbi:uncharacterized protein LOC119666180 [Teleopsis dalmanni]|uniref:uncharacterized protein LOC119666180 n=1 Tax=Teleopsis dalmanni TaxID=139649 RepID=UPI0018CF8BE2|nr:uncharacterized protein LOC119666180 [Teleopsis dalmanni]